MPYWTRTILSLLPLQRSRRRTGGTQDSRSPSALAPSTKPGFSCSSDGTSDGSIFSPGDAWQGLSEAAGLPAPANEAPPPHTLSPVLYLLPTLSWISRGADKPGSPAQKRNINWGPSPRASCCCIVIQPGMAHPPVPVRSMRALVMGTSLVHFFNPPPLALLPSTSRRPSTLCSVRVLRTSTPYKTLGQAL